MPFFTLFAIRSTLYAFRPGSAPWRRANDVRRMALLELQSRFARGIGQGLDAPVIQVAAAVEYDLVDALGLGPLGDQFADGLGRGDIAAGRLARLLVFAFDLLVAARR